MGTYPDFNLYLIFETIGPLLTPHMFNNDTSPLTKVHLFLISTSVKRLEWSWGRGVAETAHNVFNELRDEMIVGKGGGMKGALKSLKPLCTVEGKSQESTI